MENCFELIDLKSGNVIGAFRTEADALEALRRAFREHGTVAIQNLSLVLITDDDQILVAMRDELEQLVHGSLRHRVA